MRRFATLVLALIFSVAALTAQSAEVSQALATGPTLPIGDATVAALQVADGLVGPGILLLLAYVARVGGPAVTAIINMFKLQVLLPNAAHAAIAQIKGAEAGKVLDISHLSPATQIMVGLIRRTAPAVYAHFGGADGIRDLAIAHLQGMGVVPADASKADFTAPPATASFTGAPPA